MLFPPRGNHDTKPYESVGSELRHCNYVSDHLGFEEWIGSNSERAQ